MKAHLESPTGERFSVNVKYAKQTGDGVEIEYTTQSQVDENFYPDCTLFKVTKE